MQNSPEEINIFIAYAKQDKTYLEELRTQLSVLERIGLVDKIWYNGLVEIGSNWEESINTALHHSDIVLLLISADFIASDFSYEKELMKAVELDKQGKTKAIAIIARKCLWESTPFKNLRVLPDDGIPIESNHWSSEDEPYVKIVEEVEKVILNLQSVNLEKDPIKRKLFFDLKLKEADQSFEQEEWAAAKVQYQEALHYHQEGNKPSQQDIRNKIEICRKNIYFQRNVEQGTKALEKEAYAEAEKYFTQALKFKPQDAVVLSRLEECKNPKKVDDKKAISSSDNPKPKRGFRLKLFGVEIINIVMFSLLALALSVGIYYLNITPPNFTDPVAMDEFIGIEDGALMFKKDNKPVAVKVNNLNIIEAKEPKDGLLAVKNEEGNWGYLKIDDKGKIDVLGDIKYDQVWKFTESEQLAYVKKGERCSFIDKNGKELIAITQSPYIDAAPFSEGLAMVKKGEKQYAFINTKGEEVIKDIEAVETPKFKDGKAKIVRNKRAIVINRSGDCVENCVEKDKLIDDVLIVEKPKKENPEKVEVPENRATPAKVTDKIEEYEELLDDAYDEMRVKTIRKAFETLDTSYRSSNDLKDCDKIPYAPRAIQELCRELEIQERGRLTESNYKTAFKPTLQRYKTICLERFKGFLQATKKANLEENITIKLSQELDYVKRKYEYSM